MIRNELSPKDRIRGIFCCYCIQSSLMLVNVAISSKGGYNGGGANPNIYMLEVRIDPATSRLQNVECYHRAKSQILISSINIQV